MPHQSGTPKAHWQLSRMSPKFGTPKAHWQLHKMPHTSELHTTINSKADGQRSGLREVPISSYGFSSLASLEGNGLAQWLYADAQPLALWLLTAHLVSFSVSTTGVKTNSEHRGRYHSAALYCTYRLMQYYELSFCPHSIFFYCNKKRWYMCLNCITTAGRCNGGPRVFCHAWN
jgi:hypothetical protein